MRVPSGIRERFTELGHAGPIPLLSRRESRRLLRAARREPGFPLDWAKGNAANSRLFHEIGTHPTIVAWVTELLGPEVILWGAHLLGRAPEETHPWHTDIESSAPDGRTVSVWIGLENTGRESSPRFVSRSHRFGETVQEVRFRGGASREATTDEEILAWARERDERSRLERPAPRDGEALLFDGRVWHASHNGSGAPRHALLLQYATPATSIRIPDLSRLDWPFRWLDAPRPACVRVAGRGGDGPNRVVPPPREGSRRLASGIHRPRLPLGTDPEAGWMRRPIFRGATRGLTQLSCHASMLTPGSCPHPPHVHAAEEILMLLDGEVDLLLPAVPEGRRRLHPGQFAYYPKGFRHSLENVSSGPAHYLLFRWRGRAATDRRPRRFGAFDPFPREEDAASVRGFRPRRVFQGPTRWLGRLHCHATTLGPGAGYAPHADPYDVVIVVLEGEVETLGRRAGPHDVVFYAAGEPHGMRNPGEMAARYLVFELHAPPGLMARLRNPRPLLRARARRTRRALARTVRSARAPRASR